MAVIREAYVATVTVNEDDEQRGRIRVTCAGLMGDEESELPMWVEPTLDWGWFYVPDVGEIVEVEITSNSEEDEHFGQSSIDNLDIRWRGKRFYTNAEGAVGDKDQDPAVDARKVHAEFLTNYGKRRGFATPWGHTILFDDTDGDHRIVIVHSAEQLAHGKALGTAKQTRMEIEPDGSFKITMLDKHTFHVQTEGNKLLISLDGDSHKIELDANGSSLAVTIDGGVGLNLVGKDADAVTQLGDGAVSAVIAENLESWLNDVYTPAIADMHDNHFHPLPDYVAPLIPQATAPTIPGVTPGGPPMAPVIPAVLESYDGAITSTHLVFPDA